MPSGNLQCPRCQLSLAGVTAGTIALTNCAQCGGVFVAAATFQTICVDPQAQADVLALNQPPTAPIDPHVKYLKCPQCLAMMNRCNFAHRSGVIVDICKPHGIWVDHDGLRQIVAFIRAGGLERAQAAASEEKKRAEALAKLDRIEVFQVYRG